MHLIGTTWAIVLAAGEGSRLRDITTTRSGVAVPKQFCSLFGGPCLLQQALQRALAVASPPQVCSIVAAQHRRWWETSLETIRDENIIVQPQNRGTAHGILLSLLHVLARDPNANVVFLPADHYLLDEEIMACALRRTAKLASVHTNSVYLLGIEPDEPDPELGYIVPAEANRSRPSRVLRFVEKPDAARARRLLAEGALWNSFIIAASIPTLLGLYAGSFAATIGTMRAALKSDDREFRARTLERLYDGLATIDFSREILERDAAPLQVLAVPHCGWTDLGTPKRVLQTLQAAPSKPRADRHGDGAAAPYLSLAAQQLLFVNPRSAAAASEALS